MPKFRNSHGNLVEFSSKVSFLVVTIVNFAYSVNELLIPRFKIPKLLVTKITRLPRELLFLATISD